MGIVILNFCKCRLISQKLLHWLINTTRVDDRGGHTVVTRLSNRQDATSHPHALQFPLRISKRYFRIWSRRGRTDRSYWPIIRVKNKICHTFNRPDCDLTCFHRCIAMAGLSRVDAVWIGFHSNRFRCRVGSVNLNARSLHIAMVAKEARFSTERYKQYTKTTVALLFCFTLSSHVCATCFIYDFRDSLGRGIVAPKPKSEGKAIIFPWN